MVSFKELMIMAAAINAVAAQPDADEDKDQGEYDPNADNNNAGDWGGSNNYDWSSSSDSNMEEYLDRTLWVHSHTPIQDYANPETADFSKRRM